MHLMIDLETLATTPEATVLTIGACKFDPNGNTIDDTLYMRVEIDSQDRDIDPNTLEWWSKQDKQIQEEAFSDADRIPLQQAMKKLYSFGFGTNNVWSHGSIFDIVILENICRRLQQAVTWKFWQVRDTRTLFDIANDDVIVEGKHNALNDALAQAKAVQQSYKKLYGH